MYCSRRAFTLIEMLLVVVIVGVIMALAVPKFTVVREQSTVRSSRLMLASAFSAARSAAVQKGQPSTLMINESVVHVTVLSGLGRQPVTVLGPMRFDASAGGAALTPLDGVTKVTYDPRGMITPALDGIIRFEVATGNASDTLCVSASGHIMPRDCRL